MAIAVTQVGRRTVFGDRRVGFYDVVYSGNYATGGEALTPALLGLTDIDFVEGSVASSTDLVTSVTVYWNPATGKLLSYEGGGANAPSIEKQNAEAYITGQNGRIMVVGH